jgi:hypothetical protein
VHVCVLCAPNQRLSQTIQNTSTQFVDRPQTVTAPPQTVTQTLPPVTETDTETAPPVTVTEPQTQTVTETETVAPPG